MDFRSGLGKEVLLGKGKGLDALDIWGRWSSQWGKDDQKWDLRLELSFTGGNILSALSGASGMFLPEDTGKSKGRAHQCQRKAATLHLEKTQFLLVSFPLIFSPWLHSNCIAVFCTYIPNS